VSRIASTSRSPSLWCAEGAHFGTGASFAPE
jgi:hypothetical protein